MKNIFEDYNRLGVRAVAATHGDRQGRCPACGAHKRHASREDNRPAVGFADDDMRAKCFACDVAFNGVDYTAYALHGEKFRELSGPDKGACLRHMESVLAGEYTEALRDLPVPGDVIEKPYATMGEALRAIGNHLPQATKWPPARRYLESRGIRTDGMAELFFFGAIGDEFGLLFHDFQGDVCNAVLRPCRPLAPGEPKSRTLPGKKASGLVLANWKAFDFMTRYERRSSVLEGIQSRAMHNDHLAGKPATLDALYVVEGEMDFVSLCTTHPDLAVIGVRSGSLTRDYATVFERAERVRVFTDPDEAGDKYGDQIAELAPRKTKWRQRRDMDLNEELQATGTISLQTATRRDRVAA